MKKGIVIGICFALVITLTGTILWINNFFSYDIKEFHVSDYQSYIDTFPSEGKVCNTSDVKSLIKDTEEIWMDIYGKRVIWKKPYQIFYDAQNEVWLIHGFLPSNTTGGVPYILIKDTTGEVLSVWHDK